MNKQYRRVTLQDVAKHAGVSRATASLIARNSPKVSKQTREKVLKSMKELGYVYDRVAANLRSQKSMTIGTIVTDVGNTFFAQYLLGVHQELKKYGYTVLLGTTFDSIVEQEQLISTMLEYRVGGILLCPVSSSTNDIIERITNLNTPLVVGIRELPNLTCDFVGSDYESGAYMAVNHLIKKGHQRIAFLGGIHHTPTWQERMDGYKMAHEMYNLLIEDSLIIQSLVTREGGRKAVKLLMKQPNPPTAILCFNDLVAFGVIIGLRQLGYSPGEEIDVVGFDNTPESEVSFPPLTTIDTFAKLTGETAAQLLHQRITQPDNEIQRVILPPELVVRDSS